MNFKAIILVFVFQIIVGVLWYASTPSLFLGRPLLEGASQQQPEAKAVLMFAFSAFMYLLFIAWLLGKVQILSIFGQFCLVVGIWLFIVLPNLFFVSLHLELSLSEEVYLLSYGLVNTLLTALILPLSRTSRSIFKD
ncbi:hypothetical protein ABFY09_01980 [Marinomonas sp. 5E14-1]|uniref:hypothetical protein n=1 Tax=Marinomonas sp. 5E14-1 TaxID=3153922 RepID=UPI003266C980